MYYLGRLDLMDQNYPAAIDQYQLGLLLRKLGCEEEARSAFQGSYEPSSWRGLSSLLSRESSRLSCTADGTPAVPRELLNRVFCLIL